MKKIKGLTLLFLLCFLTTQSFAQNGNEIGLKLNSLQNYSAVFKLKLKENRYFRLDAGSLQATSSASRSNFRLNLELGWETRRRVTDKFSFISGPTLGVQPLVSYQRISDRWDLDLAASVGFILGGQYWLNDKFYLSLETIPTLQFTHDFDSRRTNTALNANLTQAKLGIFYAL